MNFVIGDIHGEFEKLKILISNIQEIDKNCKLIFVGDYIDKGNNSKLVLDFLVDLKKNFDCFFLIGNHEFYWMKDTFEADNYLQKYGGKQTMRSFNAKSIKYTRELLFDVYNDFFKELIPYFFIEKYFISHSGFNPSNQNQIIENIPVHEFLFNRYKFIMDKSLFQNQYKVIFGHTAFYSPYVDSTKIGIDTGACFLEDQPLSSFCIEKEFFLNSKGNSINLSEISNLYSPAIIRSKQWENN